MTPRAQAFASAYGACADQVAAATGIDRWALLIQWSDETGFGTSFAGKNNLGNIRCLPSKPFCDYATLDDFANAASSLWQSTAYINASYPNGFNPYRLAAVGQPMTTQLSLIGASPWDAGHYASGCGYNGCDLIAIWHSDFDSIDPNKSVEVLVVVSNAHGAMEFGRGKPDATTGKRGLFQRRWDNTAHKWAAWADIGGDLGVDDLNVESIRFTETEDTNGLMTVTVTGSDGLEYDTYSSDGIAWSAFDGPHGSVDGLISVNASTPASTGTEPSRVTLHVPAFDVPGDLT